MPIARVQLPNGKIGRFEVPEGTTEQQVLEFAQANIQTLGGPPAAAQTPDPVSPFQQQQALQAGQPSPVIPGQSVSVHTGQPIKQAEMLQNGMNIGAGEVAGTMLTGAIAEPLAGFGGLAKSITSGPEQGQKTIEQIRSALTYQPRTKEGQEYLSTVGDVVSPVTDIFEKIETGLGDVVYEKTGSPAIAALATTAPTLATELLGAFGIHGAREGVRAIKKARKGMKIEKAISEAAPSVEQLKTAASALYNEIDDSGAYVRANSYNSLIDDIERTTIKEGLDKDITPKAYQAVNRLKQEAGSDIFVTDLDTLRKVAKNAIDPTNPPDSRMAMIVIDKIDDFMDNSGKNIQGLSGNVGQKYKLARNLWGRARKSELLGEAVENARNQASGFENGIRTQLRAILRNKRKRKFFTTSELEAIKRVEQGVKGANLFKFLGKFGFSEGAAKSLIGSSIGIAAGAYAAGLVGAVIVPVIGQVSKSLAQRLTQGGARFADNVVRAGSNANKIAKAYLDNTPAKMRKPSELAELLMREDINLAKLPETPFYQEVKTIANDYRTSVAESILSTEAIKATNKE